MSGWFTESETRFHERAMEATGLSDFGEPEYLTGLQRLLHALDTDTELTPKQREAFSASIVTPLVSRLHAQQGWKEHPSSLENDIRVPLIIVGVPRSGTTALHKLLAIDERFQGLETWLIHAPMPRPPRDGWSDFPAYQNAVASHKARIAAMPELKTQHYVQPHEVGECLPVMAQSFISNAFGSTVSIPSYDRWFRAEDMLPVFRHHAKNLKLIGANEPDKPWLLKNPSHLLDLDTLLTVYPDARIVHIHRDPLQSMPSLVSLLSGFRRLFEGDAMCTRKIAEREVPQWKAALARALEIKQSHPKNLIDVREDAFELDPLAVVREIYDFWHVPLPSGTEARMRGWAEANPKDKHGSHRYSFEVDGLSLEGLRSEFADYREKVGFRS